MAKLLSGVAPTHAFEFGVCTTGRPADLKTATYTTVKDAEALNISIDNGVESWNPMDQKGWARNLMTAKSLSIGMGGKRNYGDAGNDYVAGLALKTGQDANSALKITFPDGDVMYVPCVIQVNSLGGDSTAVDALDWGVVSDGKPEYVEYEGEENGGE